MDRRTPISIKFEIPYFTVSGIQVRYLKIVEKSGYQALRKCASTFPGTSMSSFPDTKLFCHTFQMTGSVGPVHYAAWRVRPSHAERKGIDTAGSLLGVVSQSSRKSVVPQLLCVIPSPYLPRINLLSCISLRSA